MNGGGMPPGMGGYGGASGPFNPGMEMGGGPAGAGYKML